MSDRVPCPVEHLNFSRSVRIGDETHIQTCLKIAPMVGTASDGTTFTYHSDMAQEWTTVGIIYDRPVQKPPKNNDLSWPDAVVLVVLIAVMAVAVIPKDHR